MGEVIDLAKRKMQTHGHTAFMACDCGDLTGWQAVMVHGGEAG